jgi:hypothetical protein
MSAASLSVAMLIWPAIPLHSYVFGDTKGQNCGAVFSCIENSGNNNNPVTKAVLPINGNSFTYGQLQATYPDTWGLRRLNYPGGYAVYVSFYDLEEYTGLPNTWGGSYVRMDLDIKQYPTQVSASWEGALNYTVGPNDFYPGYDDFSRRRPKLNVVSRAMAVPNLLPSAKSPPEASLSLLPL